MGDAANLGEFIPLVAVTKWLGLKRWGKMCKIISGAFGLKVKIRYMFLGKRTVYVDHCKPSLNTPIANSARRMITVIS